MISKLLPSNNMSLTYKLVLFHTFIIALSNWLITYKFTIFGNPLAYAAFTFPLVVIATDLTVRLVGKEVGRVVVGLSFIPAIIASVLIILATGSPWSVALRIGAASGLAYLASTMLDVYVFQYFREKFTAWFIAPTFSSIFATVIDTYTFFSAAFYQSTDEFMRNNWHVVATNHIITKMIVSLLVILPIYGILLSYILKKVKR
jgi:uncharacterized integral membrane protein (TIGR00697 family)